MQLNFQNMKKGYAGAAIHIQKLPNVGCSSDVNAKVSSN
jgi:hypothetical protein